MFKSFAVVLATVLVVDMVSGHGMMLDPPNRSSLWRFDADAPINYNDNENFCGGQGVQWQENGGKCGVCGDNYVTPHPQPNENTGLYGQGKIVANYTAGEIIETYTKLTANHLGHFEFHLCEILEEDKIESGEECFKQLTFADGSTQFQIFREDKHVVNKIKLPKGYTCKHCVLRWHYTAGNTWGTCENGEQGQGCGPQETFRSCADISIL